ncbi:MAG: type IV secretory system conjugative DNA transfer family protein, partial [Candidatus Nanoarchaeia archaeon]
TIPAGGLWGNLIAFGGIGSGKTASFIRPAVRQLFEYNSEDTNKKFGGLVMDAKGDFIYEILDLAKEYKRENDIVRIGPQGDFTWNPIHMPHVEPGAIALRLIAVQENLTGGSGTEGNWVVDASLKLLTHSIGLHRLAYGYVTLKDVNVLIQDTNVDPEAEAMQRAAGMDFEDPVASIILKYEHAIQERYKNGEVGEKEIEEFEYHARYFMTEWKRENSKNRATISNDTMNITGQFANPKYVDVFCPNKDNITFPGFYKLIDDGKIVCLDAPEAEYGGLASMLGIMLKLDFQRAALTRIVRAKKDPQTNTKRPLVFLCDEYQNFVTTTGKRTKEGDDNFYALSRQSRCISIVCTQGIVSLQAKIGEEKCRLVLNNLRTKIFMSLEDAKDTTLAADTMGKDWTAKENRSVNESVDGAGYDVITNTMSGKSSSVGESISYQEQLVHRVEPVYISSLRTFECFAHVFDGAQKRKPERVLLKTDFCPDVFKEQGFTGRTVPYKDLIEWFAKVQEED